MLHCKVFLTYKRKRQSSVSVPKETPIPDKSLSEDETVKFLHVGRDSTESPSTQNKNIDECSEDGSRRNIVPNEPHYLQIGSSSSVNADILGDNIHTEFHDTPSKDDLTVLGSDSARFRAPLITFIRRCKRKRDVEDEDETVNKRSNKSLCEAASENGCDETDSKPLEEAHHTIDTICQDENKIKEAGSASDNVIPGHCDKTLAPEREEPLDGPNVLKNVQEDMECNEISLNNATKDTSSNKVEESCAILNDGVNEITEGPRPFLDLSVTPTEGSSGTPECNVYVESNSQKRSVHAVTETVLGSMDSTSRSHTAFFHQTFPPETSNFRNAFVVEPSYKDIYKAPPIPLDVMSKNKCLQLFAEERTEDSFRSCMVSEERNIFRFEMENKSPKIKSPPPPAFLGLSLPTKPKTARYNSKRSFSPFPFLSSIGEIPRPFEDTTTVPQSSSSRFSSILKNTKSMYGSAWTEEELDSLWIGVRRYGRENWDAMVRDPRLRFASWRVATDLAEKWEVEQYKLFQYQNSKPQGVSSGIDETQLSLGDVYNSNYISNNNNNNNTHRGRNATRRARFKTAKTNPVRGPYLDYQGMRFEDYGFKFNNCLRDNGSVSCPTQGNLPHWLREAVFSAPPAVMPVARSRSDHYELQKVGPPKGKDLQTPGDVIVIESDASSEETISDHR